MKYDHSKALRQDEGVDKFRYSKKYGSSENGRGVFHYVTGFGKTASGMKVAVKFYLHDPINNDIIILVPSEAIKKQWLQEVADCKHDIDARVLTADEALNKKIVFKCGLLIVDELHKFYGGKRKDLINGKLIKFVRNLGLTGTYFDYKKEYKNHQTLWPIIDTVTQKEGEEKGWISKSFEFNIGVSLTVDEQIKYDELSKIISTQLPKFGKGKALTAMKYCLNGGIDVDGNMRKAYDWACMVASSHGWSSKLKPEIPEHKEILDMWTPNLVIGYAKKGMEAMQLRKHLLYSAKNKLDIVLQIVEKFRDVKTMAFSQSTEFASNLAKKVNDKFEDSNYAICYHSGLSSIPLRNEKGEWIRYASGKKKGQVKLFGKTTLKNLAVKAIKTGESKLISTVSALDAGFNVEDLRIIIITGGTQNHNQHKQRKGRGIRKEDNFDGHVLIINVYVKDTREVDWLRSRLEKTYKTTRWVDDVDDISYTPKPIKNTLQIH